MLTERDTLLDMENDRDGVLELHRLFSGDLRGKFHGPTIDGLRLDGPLFVVDAVGRQPLGAGPRAPDGPIARLRTRRLNVYSTLCVVVDQDPRRRLGASISSELAHPRDVEPSLLRELSRTGRLQ